MLNQDLVPIKDNRNLREHPWLSPVLICSVNGVLPPHVHSLLFGKGFLFPYRIPMKIKFVLFRFQVVTIW